MACSPMISTSSSICPLGNCLTCFRWSTATPASSFTRSSPPSIGPLFAVCWTAFGNWWPEKDGKRPPPTFAVGLGFPRPNFHWPAAHWRLHLPSGGNIWFTSVCNLEFCIIAGLPQRLSHRLRPAIGQIGHFQDGPLWRHWIPTGQCWATGEAVRKTHKSDSWMTRTCCFDARVHFYNLISLETQKYAFLWCTCRSFYSPIDFFFLMQTKIISPAERIIIWY